MIISGIIPFEDWKKRAGKDLYLRPIYLLDEYLRKNIKDELIGFYLHGSLASLDYVQGYSDFDAIALVNEEALEDHHKRRNFKKKMAEINRFPFLMDILQHHGITLIRNGENEEIDFPIELFKGVVALGESSLEPKLFSANFDSKKILVDFCNYFKNYFLKNKKLKSALDLKSFLSMVQMLPALYLQAKTGKYINKKSSFGEARNDFGEEWRVIEKASQVRKIWRYSPVFSAKMQDLLLKIPNLERLAWFYGKFLFLTPKEVKKIIGPEIIKEAFLLAESIAEKINKQ